MSVTVATRPHRGSIEAAAAVGLYAVYELVRGFGGEDWSRARLHTEWIVALEQHLGVYWEHAVQRLALDVPGLASLLGFLYITLHLGATGIFLVWVYRRRRDAFALVRTAIVLATAIALVVYVAYPAAPPRLADLGFADAVSAHTGLNLSSDLLGALYNPLAAVPSLHFGYALLVGVGVAVLADRRWVRIVGGAYPLLMLFVIVATGNHFLFDAAAGGLVVVVAWLAALRIVDPPARRATAAHRA
jgi:PAP2 superfamily